MVAMSGPPWTLFPGTVSARGVGVGGAQDEWMTAVQPCQVWVAVHQGWMGA